MARRTIKISYKIRVTRRVRVETRVHYSVRTLSVVQLAVAQARERGDVSSEYARTQIMASARALLPAGTGDAEILDAIDAVCKEMDDE
jgi:hypothetical protein